MYAYLKQHPEIYLSILKEPHFFGSDLTIQPHTIRDRNTYLTLFRDAGEEHRILGEASVWYLLSRRAAREIDAFSPGAKILIMLRDPVDMAFSLYGLYRRSGNEDAGTFAEALHAEEERRRGGRIPASAYFPEGLLYSAAVSYRDQVARYLEVFGGERVFCLLFDDFVSDPNASTRRILEFLGVDASAEIEFDRAEATRRLRSGAIRQLLRADPEVRSRMTSEGMRSHSGRPPTALDPELRERLRKRFRPQVEQLGELLGRDLSHWCRGRAHRHRAAGEAS